MVTWMAERSGSPAGNRRLWPADDHESDDEDVALAWPQDADRPAAIRRADGPAVAPPASGGADPGANLLTAIAARVESIDEQLRTVATRLDLLSSAVVAVRSSVADRLDGLEGHAAQTSTSLQDAQREQGSTAERTAGELAALRETVNKLTARVDALLGTTHRPPDLRPLEQSVADIRALLDIVIDAMPGSAPGTGS